MWTPEPQTTTATKLKRIAWLSSQSRDKVFGQLMHHINEELLRSCYQELDGKKAVGVDGIDKASYGGHLEQNLKELVMRMKRMGYRPGPVRLVQIPKEGKLGATRPLGISNFEDKLVQMGMHKVLESIYEPIFLNCSYGFRPGRGCHDAIRALSDHLHKNQVETVIDIDLANFFGSIAHKEVEKVLREKIADPKFMRYIIRMFKAGVLADGELSVSEEGVAQGSVCSPILANIFAHHVIDEWFEGTVKKHCAGRVEMFRYADDLVICCQSQRDGERIKRALSQRLAKYKLKLNEDKTKCVEFSKRGYNAGRRQGVFDFLGFTFYLGRSKKGFVITKLKTTGKRMRSKLKTLNKWARENRNAQPTKVLWGIFCAKVRGHIQYYAVSHNLRYVLNYIESAKRIIFKWLNRRSQRTSFDWDRFTLFMKRFPLPIAKVKHALF